MENALATTLDELKRAWPYALVLAVALGAVVGIGAHLSNATPYDGRPFGWPGPSSLDNAVAAVRSDLVLAASLPGLLLGARALRREHRLADLPIVFGADATLLFAGGFAAAGIGAIVASKAAPQAFLAFAVAHSLLALAFYALAFLCSAVFRGHATAAALLVWLFFLGMYESLTRIGVFRQVGLDAIKAGALPSWFYVAQALSPLSAYRGVLIFWRPLFMDYLEKYVLGAAQLPAWMNPGTFAAFMVGLWVLLPLGLACLAWWVRGWLATRAATTRAEPA